jgi:hypothetical protein
MNLLKDVCGGISSVDEAEEIWAFLVHLQGRHLVTNVGFSGMGGWK